MRNVQKILIGVFVSGVMLGGIGTGIALKEFSDLSYGGRTVVGAEHLVTKELDFQFPLDGKTLILGYNYGNVNRKTKLVEDGAIPVGTVRYEVTYNEQLIDPFLGYEEYEESGELQEAVEEREANSDLEGILDGDSEPAESVEAGESAGESSDDELDNKEPVYAGILRLCFSYEGNDFELFMENKNRILEDLKQKRMSSYEVAEVTEVTIKVNPETMQYIEEGFSIY